MKTTQNSFLKTILALFVACLLASCASKPYISPEIKALSKSNTTMAVLPYNIIFEGKMPKDLTAEQMKTQDEKEQLAFQQSLFSQVSSKLSGSNFRLQSMATTNAKLIEMGIDLHKIQDYKPELLAEKLGVDMIVVPSLTKHRYRSDEASAAITAIKIIAQNIPSPVSAYAPYIDGRTNDVKASFTIVAAKSGNLLWSIERKMTADWFRPVETAVDRLNVKMARKLKKIS
jgi:hypothetical protein